jgi:uncharacterized protein (DUF1501 family)
MKVGALASAGLTGLLPAKTEAAGAARADAAIVITMSGGPGQLDTFDSKPLAPSAVRGPFRPIPSTVPGLQLSELFPALSRQAHRLAVVRSLHQEMAPVHEVGRAVLGESAPLGPTQINLSGGDFGRNCRQAAQLVQAGIRFVKIDMYPRLLDRISWDCHANEADLRTTLDDYRKLVAPQFDQGVSSLLSELAGIGLLDRTLVVCLGEFGRSPFLNARGGRDHWTGVWSGLFVGGGVRGGQVLGSSDRLGGEPRDFPVKASRVFPTILHALGLSGAFACDGHPARPILELF